MSDQNDDIKRLASTHLRRNPHAHRTPVRCLSQRTARFAAFGCGFRPLQIEHSAGSSRLCSAPSCSDASNHGLALRQSTAPYDDRPRKADRPPSSNVERHRIDHSMIDRQGYTITRPALGLPSASKSPDANITVALQTRYTRKLPAAHPICSQRAVGDGLTTPGERSSIRHPPPKRTNSRQNLRGFRGLRGRTIADNRSRRS